MDIITTFLKDIGLKWDFETLYEKENYFVYELGGHRKFKKRTFLLHEYIQSYQFFQRNHQEFWISLNMVIKKEYNNYVFWLIDNILKENDQIEFAVQDSISETTPSSLTKNIYLNNNFRIYTSIENSNLSVEIIKYE